MLPLSTAMDHRSKEDLLEDCVTLATVTHSPGELSVTTETDAGGGMVSRPGTRLHLTRDSYENMNSIIGSM